MGYIKGTYRKSIFKSNKGYIIGIFKISDTDESELSDFLNKTITFTGYFHELLEDENYTFKGNVVVNPKYGTQYNVTEYERNKPEGKDGLITFLSSDIFSGVGMSTATKIVDILGENALDLILENYENLLLVPSITIKKAQKIYDTLIKYNESYDTIVYLTDFGFTMPEALKIYNYYYKSTKEYIMNNPYDAVEIDGITFNKIDSLRENFDIDVLDQRRVEAAIIYVINHMCFSTGDTYVTKENLYNQLLKIILSEISLETFEYYLINLNKMGKIIIDNDLVSLRQFKTSEVNIASNLIYLNNLKSLDKSKVDKYISHISETTGITYNERQKEAITSALCNNLTIITGGPGTGKTTIVRGITQIYEYMNGYTFDTLNEKMVLLAPTGRAAKRLSDSCGMPAYTVHRFLKWNRETNEFQINENNKSSVEFVIVDEVSMIDVLLFSSLFKGLSKNVKLVLIGDYHQLESVGPGKVLKDMIDSSVLNVITLTELYRQKEDSYIVSLADNVKNGIRKAEMLENKNDYEFQITDNVLNSIKEVCNNALSEGLTYKEIQVLAPMYKGYNGIDSINKILQEVFNPKNIDKKELKYGDVIYRENDKILQLENRPDDNVFNGDIGIISSIDKGEINVNYDGNVVKYEPKDFNSIKHGYAISIHKSQGSEFNTVIVPIVKDYKFMLYRKLIYTAITRAKSKLYLIGEVEAFGYAIKNERAYERKTFLKKLLLNE